MKLMAYLVLVILDDIDRLPLILKVWQTIGIPGVTILESTGGYRTTTWLSQVGLDFLDRLFETEELTRRTLMAAIDDESLMEQAVAEAERVMDGFDRPNSGILMVLPIHLTRGMTKPHRKEKTVEPAPILQSGWSVHRNTRVSEVLDCLTLEPTIVNPDTPLKDVAKEMFSHPTTHVACVVNENGRLLGLIDLNQLANDIFFHIDPEEFLSEITSLDDVMRFADESRKRTAADSMQDPIWVKKDDRIKEAFERMHENRVPGLPVVDEQYHIIGYVNLLELMAVCLDFDEDASHAGGKG
jgi:CBS domain-containing protein